MTVPYMWLNNLLLLTSFGALLAAGYYTVAALRRARGNRKQPLLRAATCLAGFLALGAANYAVIFLVQLPALARQSKQAAEARRKESETGSRVKVGDPAPAFRVKTDRGETFALEELRGKVVLLNFFATWCGPCRLELPHIEKLWKQYGSRDDFALLVIGREETRQTVQDYVTEHGYTFPVAPDPERVVYSLFAEELIPRTYVIGRDGRITYATFGFREEDAPRLEAELARQLNAGGE